MTHATNPEHDDRIDEASTVEHDAADDAADHAADDVQIDDSPEARLAAAEAERDEYAGRYQRALADFQNYQKRASRSEQQASVRGADRVLASIVPVLDHFDNALKIDPATAKPEQLADGIRVIQDEMLKALASHGVERIAPEVGAEFDPNRHEALMRQPAGELAPGSVVQLLQPGYAVGERVIRPAKVAVAEGEE